MPTVFINFRVNPDHLERKAKENKGKKGKSGDNAAPGTKQHQKEGEIK